MYSICLYKELHCPTAPSVSTAMSNSPHPDKARLLAYLENHDVLAVAAMIARDVITGDVIGAPKQYSDGVFVWESTDIYYFDKYNIDLTSRFIDHVLKY